MKLTLALSVTAIYSMDMESSKQRQVKFKKAKKEAGFIRIEFWIRPEWKQAILDYIKGLK